MKNTMLKFLGIALTAAVSISPVARAQMGQQGMGSQGMGQAQQQQQTPPPAAQTPPATPPPVDPAEEAAYKLASVRTTDGKQIVTASNDFLKKYPNSRYAGLVYAQLAMAYLQQGEGDKAGAAAQKALQINQDSPDALPVMAMVTAHLITGARDTQRIQQTETYANHGIQLLNALQKGPDVTDVDFTTQRNERLALCHGALGLAYLHESKGPLAVQHLVEATKLENPPDASDMYLLAVAYDSTGQNALAISTSEAACPKLSGPMQQRCIDFLKEVKAKAPKQ